MSQDKKGRGNSIFMTAKPVWPEEIRGQMNYTLKYRAIIDKLESDNVILKIAVATLYRIFINGKFVAYGPTRAAEGCFRVDQLNISDKLSEGKNIIAIEVIAYNAETHYIITQPEFIQVEVVNGGNVIASTAGEGILFEASIYQGRVQKVPRFSVQRGFIEYYRLDSGFEDWKEKENCDFKDIEYKEIAEKRLLPRIVEHPDYSVRTPVREVQRGTFIEDLELDASWMPVWTPMVGRLVKGYSPDEFEVNPIKVLNKIKIKDKIETDRLLSVETLFEIDKGSYHIIDFGKNLTGFIGSHIIANEKSTIYFVFDEILFNGDVSIKRAGVNTIIGYELEKGIYNLESIEPYTLRYLKILLIEGSCEINNTYLREYANPGVNESKFSSNDRKLNQLFRAGRETFRQNAVDILTDCPSRERGGYLCDSFFTARAGFDLTGNTQVERNFLENYLLTEEFKGLPDGMIPMCYPADPKANYRAPESSYALFIPNWSLWFIVELEEFLKRSGDLEFKERAKVRVLKILDYFKSFENEDGLLENLEGWVFIEWSKANEYIQDVNYPTNMLYAGAMAAAGRIYNMRELIEHSNTIKKEIRKQAYDGTFFIDNAVRENEELKITDNRTEVCQYYAFFFDIASPKSHKKLWNILKSDFGPGRIESGVYPEIDPANAFIGNYLRLDLLSCNGLGKQLIDESVDYFMHMVEKTGTLWEYIDDSASCNHGFGSHIVHWLYRNVVGIADIDVLNKIVSLRFEESDLKWAEGRIPLSTGNLSLSWWKEDGSLFYNLELPPTYKIEVENMTNLCLVRK